jgi:hypothetical protein
VTIGRVPAAWRSSARPVGAATFAAVLGLALVSCGGGGAKPSSAERNAAPAPKPKTGAVPWPAPKDALDRARIARVPVDRHEYGIPGHSGKHIHAHLDVFVNGVRARVPAGIGIQVTVRGVQHGRSPDGTPAYGGIRLCASPCIAALHTHDDTGVLHVESQQPREYTLGEFFTEWNVRLDERCVGGYCKPDSILVFANGKHYEGNPASLELKNLEEIAVVIGSSPKSIPHSYF